MSTILVDNLTGKTSAGDITVTSEGGAATQSLQQGLAKVWVNFNGTGTIAARDSLNLASLSDDGTGRYRANHSSSMSNAHYSIGSFAGGTDNDANISLEATGNHTMTTSECTVVVRQSSGNSLEDMSYVFATIHGDLA